MTQISSQTTTDFLCSPMCFMNPTEVWSWLLTFWLEMLKHVFYFCQMFISNKETGLFSFFFFKFGSFVRENYIQFWQYLIVHVNNAADTRYLAKADGWKTGGGKKSFMMATNIITSLEIVILNSYVDLASVFPHDWFLPVWIRQWECDRMCLTWAANDGQHLSAVDSEAEIVDSFLLVSLCLPWQFELWQPLVPGDLSRCVHLGARTHERMSTCARSTKLKQLQSKEDCVWGQDGHLSVTSQLRLLTCSSLHPPLYVK